MLSKESQALDRMGKLRHRQFRILHADHVLRFVDYDLFDNTLFVLNCLILRQGGSGVPIGGFISTKLAELWALWRENRQLQGEVEDRNSFESAWNDAMYSQETVFPEFHLSERPVRPSLCGSVTGPSDFPLSPAASSSMQVCGRMMRSRTPHLVSWPVLHNEGFQGWWAPVEATLASLQVDSVPIFFLKSTLWDGAPEGRLSLIVKHMPARDGHKVGVHLKGFDVFRSVLNEALHPPDWGGCDGLDSEGVPFVLFGRYRDNIYVVYSALPPDVERWVHSAVPTCPVRYPFEMGTAPR